MEAPVELAAQLEEPRSIYKIPAENMEKFEKQVAKLSKRSEKLIGLPIKPVVFGYDEIEAATGSGIYRRVYEVYFTAETPKINGWTFLARIDHANETGNIIRAVPNTGIDLPEQYRTAHPNCDHCQINRRRRDTFVLRCDETGEFKQVGTSCLKDFFGHDPQKIARLAEMLGYAVEVARASEQYDPEGRGLNELRWISVEKFVAHAAMNVRKHGWVSGGAAKQNDSLTSTRDRAEVSMRYEYEDGLPSKDDHATAEAALDWARSLADPLNDYLHNIRVVANAEVMEYRSMGLAASIVSAYLRTQPAPQPVKLEGDFSRVANLLKPKDSQIRFPKVTLATADGTPVVLAVAGAAANYPNSINVSNGKGFNDVNNEWYGRIMPDGEWRPANRGFKAETLSSVYALLTAFARDPETVASQYGKASGRCCFCFKTLTTPESREVGYGPDCAAKGDLPWGNKRRRVAENA